MSSPDSFDPRAPIVVAVTGHRRLATGTEDEARAAITRQLELLQQRLHNSPVVLASGVAAGADSIAAEVALDLGIPLHAVLPLPREEYAKDFSDPDERARLEHLLERAARIVHVSDDVPSPRNLAYRALGAHLVRHAQVLLAVWDGTDQGGVGGTSEVVARARGDVPLGERGVRLPLETADVVHIQATRAAPAADAAPSRHAGPYGQTDRIRAHHARLVQALERFNGELRRQREPASFANGWDQGGEAEWGDTRHLVGIHRRVNALAARWKKRALRDLGTLTMLAAATLVALLVYTDAGESKWALLGYALLLGSAAAFWRFGTDRGGRKTRHLEYRALAEALRVQAIWQRSGRPRHVADHYLGAQLGRVEWIRAAVLGWRFLGVAEGHGRPHDAFPAWATFAHERWIANQRSWSAGARIDRQRAARLLLWIRRVATVLAGGTATVLLWHTFANDIRPTLAFDLADALRVASSGFLVVVAVVAYYGNVRGYDEEAEHYRRMREFFGRAIEASNELLAAGDDTGFGELLDDIGREALEENAHWLVLHFNRPLEAP